MRDGVKVCIMNVQLIHKTYEIVLASGASGAVFGEIAGRPACQLSEPCNNTIDRCSSRVLAYQQVILGIDGERSLNEEISGRRFSLLLTVSVNLESDVLESLMP